MLSALVHKELASRRISAREAAREMGITHTTVIRILEGKPSDLETIKKTSAWLKVDPISVLNISFQDDKKWLWKFAAILENNPNMLKAFQEIIEDVEVNDINFETINEITSFINFALRKQSRSQ